MLAPFSFKGRNQFDSVLKNSINFVLQSFYQPLLTPQKIQNNTPVVFEECGLVRVNISDRHPESLFSIIRTLDGREVSFLTEIEQVSMGNGATTKATLRVIKHMIGLSSSN
jgi:hypothetical protein